MSTEFRSHNRVAEQILDILEQLGLDRDNRTEELVAESFATLLMQYAQVALEPHTD